MAKNINTFVYNNMSGKFIQSAINPMNALLYSQNQQPQAWHESLMIVLTLSFDSTFNVLKICNHVLGVGHALEYVLEFM
jgi:hypothetical protein